MRIGYRKEFAVFVLMTFVAWMATRASLMAQANVVDKLTGASECTASAYHVSPGDNATITLRNDGGWCWADTDESTYWRNFSADYVAVTDQPTHGRVLVGDVANQKIRVAYRPMEGFVGNDRFVVHSQVTERDLTYLVTVSR